MPVIINDFEIVLDPPAERDGAAAESAAPAPAASPRPEPVLEIARRAAERRARLRAD